MELGSILNLIATVLLVLVTAWYTWLTQKMLRAQVTPFVNVGLDRNDEGVVSLVLRNDGLGAAYDVKAKMPSSFFNPAIPGPGDLSRGPVGRGVAALGPRGEARQIWAHERELAAALGEADHEVVIVWRERRGGRIIRVHQTVGMSDIDPIRLVKT